MRILLETETLFACGGATSAHDPKFWPQQIALNPAFTARLTPRQAQCLAWVAAGKTSTEIATILELSSLTVDSYIKDACSILAVPSRMAAVVAALQPGALKSDTHEISAIR